MKAAEKERTKSVSKDDEEDCVEECAPEGGWGYVVCVGFSIIFTILIGPMSSVGLLFTDFLVDIGDSSAMILLFGIFNAVVSLTGLLTTCALKRFTLRQVGLLGAVMHSIGSFLSIFVTSIPHLIVANGVLQAIGFGIMIPVSLTTFNNYFIRKRAAMMGVVSVVIGVSAVVYPMGIELMMQEFGFRGTLALLCAINLNSIPGMAVMHPVEWHTKQKTPNSKDIELIEDKKRLKEFAKLELPELKNGVYIDHNSNKANRSTESVKVHLLPKPADSKPLIKNTGSLNSLRLEIKPMHEHLIRPKSNTIVNKISERKLEKVSSLRSLGNWTGNALATETVTTKEGKLKVLIDFLDLSLLKDPVYTNICFGMAMAFFSDTTFFTLEPMFLNAYGFSKPEIALCITAGAVADLASRAIFALVSFFTNFKSRNVFFFGNLFTIIFKIAFTQFTDFYHLLTLTACLGFFRNWLHVNIPLTFADYGTPSRFPAAYGLFMMISGVLSLLLGPLVGFLRDFTNDNVLTQHALTACSLFCTIFWIIEFAHSRLKKKNQNNPNEQLY